MAGERASIDHAFHWSINKLASGLGIDRRTLSKRIQEAGIQPCGERQGHPVYALSEVAKIAHSGPITTTGPGDLDNFPEARKAWFQSENERIKFETSIRQLVPATDVVKALAFMAKTLGGSLDSLPDQLERDAGLPPSARPLVQAVCDGIRERNYEALLKFKLEGDDGGA